MALYLASFPVDLTRPIAYFLPAEDIAYLWFTGDKRLQAIMSHGVQDFVLNKQIVWPGLIRHLRLSAFKITSPAQEECPCCLTKGLNLLDLPVTLQELTLHIPDALSHLCLLPSGSSLASLCPTLKSLDMQELQYIPNFDRRCFIKNLPFSLEKLKLPYNVGFDVDSLLQLPCLLLELSVSLQGVRNGTDEVRFREAKVFSRLLDLSLTVWPSVRATELIPPSVIAFQWAIQHTSMTRNGLTQFNFARNVPDSWQTDVKALASDLPRQLTSLALPWDFDYHVDHLTNLPPTLTHLQWQRLGSVIEREPDHILPRLPPTLTEFDSLGFSLSHLAEFKLLPKSLTCCSGLIANLT